jgi:hypothetical protein
MLIASSIANEDKTAVVYRDVVDCLTTTMPLILKTSGKVSALRDFTIGKNREIWDIDVQGWKLF